MTTTITTTTTFNIESCPKCGIQFAITAEYMCERQRDHLWFHCPAGHSMSYVAKNEAEMLRAKLDQMQADRDNEKRLHAEALHKLTVERAEATRQRKRTAAGVCPCCNRSYVQVARHMRSQHPGYVAKAASR